MDLRNAIRPDLWNEISNSYIAENYANSIQVAMLFLSKTIQEKSSLDLDGVKLVTQAFGGEEPKLRLNKFQTETEKSEQRGFQSILTGLYSAIRNPRAHEIIRDSKHDADPIIYFINYLLNKIDIAKPPFSVTEFVTRVFDKDFVFENNYAIEMVNEVPRKRYLETLIEIYNHKSEGFNPGISLVFPKLAHQLTPAEIEQLMAVVSKDLDLLSDDDSIKLVLKIIPEHSWQFVKASAKMRIENKLINSIQKGRFSYYHMYDEFVNGKPSENGQFGTSVLSILSEFTRKEDLRSTITDLLRSSSSKRHRYVVYEFLGHLPEIIDDPLICKLCTRAMKNLIADGGDKLIKLKVVEFLKDCPQDWFNAIKEEFRDLTDPNLPAFILRDGSPFLSYEYIDLPYDEDDELSFYDDSDDESNHEYGHDEEEYF